MVTTDGWMMVHKHLITLYSRNIEVHVIVVSDMAQKVNCNTTFLDIGAAAFTVLSRRWPGTTNPSFRFVVINWKLRVSKLYS